MHAGAFLTNGQQLVNRSMTNVPIISKKILTCSGQRYKNEQLLSLSLILTNWLLRGKPGLIMKGENNNE